MAAVEGDEAPLNAMLADSVVESPVVRAESSINLTTAVRPGEAAAVLAMQTSAVAGASINDPLYGFQCQQAAVPPISAPSAAGAGEAMQAGSAVLGGLVDGSQHRAGSEHTPPLHTIEPEAMPQAAQVLAGGGDQMDGFSDYEGPMSPLSPLLAAPPAPGPVGEHVEPSVPGRSPTRPPFHRHRQEAPTSSKRYEKALRARQVGLAG
jgi:hypothetical protein